MARISEHLLRRERILLIVAHPDDESLGAGILLQRNPNVHVVFCTSGAPNRLSIWRRFGSPWHYARIREREARTALRIAGNEQCTFLRFRDGKLYSALPRLNRRLAGIVKRWKAELIVTHAFEGGHQDHDVCSFLCARLSQNFDVPVQEMPLYRPNPAAGGLVYQTFATDMGEVECLQPTPAELETKQKMVAAHKSQDAVTSEFNMSREVFRAQISHNYLQPATEGASTIAVSGLPSSELVAAFRAFSLSDAPPGKPAASL
jgi:LmbE family N-acetylglucosaminyl deacetylase